MDNRAGSVQRRTEDQIERLAKVVRQELGVDQNARLSMQPILDHLLEDMVEDAYLVVAHDGEMAGAEGRTDWHRPVITLSASTYAALAKGNHRARMTAAHELGHLLMHTRRPVFHYRSKSRDRRVDPEWQADTFAAALLMPREGFRRMKTVRQAQMAFGVSRGAALVRARRLNMQIIDDAATGRSRKKKGHSMRCTP